MKRQQNATTAESCATDGVAGSCPVPAAAVGSLLVAGAVTASLNVVNDVHSCVQATAQNLQWSNLAMDTTSLTAGMAPSCGTDSNGTATACSDLVAARLQTTQLQDVLVWFGLFCLLWALQFVLALHRCTVARSGCLKSGRRRRPPQSRPRVAVRRVRCSCACTLPFLKELSLLFTSCRPASCASGISPGATSRRSCAAALATGRRWRACKPDALRRLLALAAPPAVAAPA